MGTLYVVSTPIGNLEDLSPRATRVLREVSVIAAEDTRVVAKLLNYAGARTRTISYHSHSPPASSRRVIRALEKGDVALVSDAGAPAVSDPGAELVALAAASGHRVVTIPGPSAITAALAVSGMPADRFSFVGFLPRKRGDRRRALKAASLDEETTVCFEAPHRLRDALSDIAEVFSDRPIAVCRELTKLYEETFRGTAAEALERFTEPRGEFVIVIAGGAPAGEEEVVDGEIESALESAASRGLEGRSLVDEVTAATGAPRRRVYRLAIARAHS